MWTAPDVTYPLVDLDLARRLERIEARANARFVESRARVAPEVGARWIDVAGAYAMFDGVDSPCTQTFGLGLFDAAGPDELDALEAFFLERGAAVVQGAGGPACGNEPARAGGGRSDAAPG